MAWTVAGVMYITSVIGPTFWAVMRRTMRLPMYDRNIIIFSFSLSLAITIALGLFTLWNTYLTLRGMTTLEFVSGSGDDTVKKASG